MSAESSVALVCVTHDSSALLPAFASATREGVADCNARVIVVDSGSTDDTLASVAALLPAAEICELDGNRGFAAGINAGVRHVQASGGADAFVVMNPDVRLRRDTVPLLLAGLRQDGVGMAVPQLRDEHGDLYQSLRRVPSVMTAWCEALLGGPLADRLHLPTEVVWDERCYLADRGAAWATGALMAISAECLERVGPWDESYFLYEEEVDFSLRAADAGFGLVYVSEAVATRLLGEGPVAPWVQALMHANRMRLMGRRRSKAEVALVRGALLAGDGLRAILGRPEASAAVWAVWHRASPSMVMARYRPRG